MFTGPRTLILETTNHCNLHCPFCPHKDMKRPLGLMTDEVFETVISKVKGFGIKTINPYMFGESFMDKKIYDRVRYIRNELPTAKVLFYTNLGIPLKEGELHKLEGSYFVNSFTREVDFEIRARNIELLKKHGFLVEVHAVQEDPSIRDDFISEALAFGFEHDIPVGPTVKYNWRGKIPSAWPTTDGHCCRQGNDLVVLWDGRVALCCMDIEGDTILGDLKTQSLGEVWNGEVARRFRSHKKSELDFCRECNMEVRS